jgi:hypothetical protein
MLHSWKIRHSRVRVERLYVQIESSETSHSQCLGVVGYVIFTMSLCMHVSCPCSYEWASNDHWVRVLSTPPPKSGVETHEVDHNCVLKLIRMLHKQHWMNNSFMHIIYLALDKFLQKNHEKCSQMSITWEETSRKEKHIIFIPNHAPTPLLCSQYI